MISSIQDTYLNTLAALLESEKLGTLLQDTTSADGFQSGVLWAVREGTTVPELSLSFKFDCVGLMLRAMTRDERTMDYKVDFSGGIDEYLKQLRTFLRANRIAHKKAA
jgi:hypothetical protein